jgi:IS30 family transposase
VIDYETFCKIHDCHDRQGLTIAQTARALGLHPQTVATWVARSRFEPRRSRARSSVLCVGHVRQLGGESPLCNLMEVKH